MYYHQHCMRYIPIAQIHMYIITKKYSITVCVNIQPLKCKAKLYKSSMQDVKL
jgi:hypothetical protein